MSEQRFTWVPFYEELAKKLLAYKDNRPELIKEIKKVYTECKMDINKLLRKADSQNDIDPFSLFTEFNRSIKDETRIKICKAYKEVFHLDSNCPSSFEGIPVRNNLRRLFYTLDGDERYDPNCFNILWELFEAAQADETNRNTSIFNELFNKSLKLNCVALASLSMALFWIQPNRYVNLDKKNTLYISDSLHINLKQQYTGIEYLELCKTVLSKAKAILTKMSLDLISPELSLDLILPELSLHAHNSYEKSLNPPSTNKAVVSQKRILGFLRKEDVFTKDCKKVIGWMYEQNGPVIFSNTRKAWFNAIINLAKTIDDAAPGHVWIMNPQNEDDNTFNVLSILFQYIRKTRQKPINCTWQMREELKAAYEEWLELKEEQPQMEKKNSKQMYPLNTIFYGPPGTGKTYHTAIYAVAIIDGKPLDEIKQKPYDEVMQRYHELRDKGQIAFTTFHQSYGYEDFIEGIRPVLDNESDENPDENANVLYICKDGVFKAFCEKASDLEIKFNGTETIWKVSLEGAGDNATRDECMENDHIRIGWDQYGATPDLDNLPSVEGWSLGFGKVVLNTFMNRMKIGDIVFSCYDSSTIDAIGVITSDAFWDGSYEYYNRVRTVRWLVKGIKYNIMAINGNKPMMQSTVYELNSVTVDDVMRILRATIIRPNHVFIIDEINRGNISKVFGELITLIEETKRAGNREEMSVTLPYSHKPFSVPNNVYILGTMNTADRSIALLDTALRRRFSFIEMMPDIKALKGIKVEEINISKMLEVLNQRIEVLYDREHTIGHAYFMTLTSESKVEDLGKIFRERIIPLLQEYFYDDYEKIRLVLGDSKRIIKNNKHKFILTDQETIDDKKPTDIKSLFGDINSDYDFTDQVTYRINTKAFDEVESYRKIYESGGSDETESNHDH